MVTPTPSTLVFFETEDSHTELRSSAPLDYQELRLLRYLLLAALPAGDEVALPCSRLAELFPHTPLSPARAEKFLNVRVYATALADEAEYVMVSLFERLVALNNGRVGVSLTRSARAFFDTLPLALPLTATLLRPHLKDAGSKKIEPEVVALWHQTLVALKGECDGEPDAGVIPSCSSPLELYGHLVRAFYGDAPRLGGNSEPHTLELPLDTLRQLAPENEVVGVLQGVLYAFVQRFPVRLRINGVAPGEWSGDPWEKRTLTVEVTPLGFDAYPGVVPRGV